MSQPLPDDDDWAVQGGDESQGSSMFSNQQYSQQLPFPPNRNNPQYTEEDFSQLEDDNGSMDMGSLVEHRLDEPPTTTENTNQGVPNAGLGTLIARPPIADPQQEVNDTFSFAQHDLRKSSQQRRSGQEMGPTTTTVGGNGPTNAHMSTQHVVPPQPQASPALSRHSSIKKPSPVQARETMQPIPGRSSTTMQRHEDTNTQDQNGDNQEDQLTYRHQGPEKSSLPEELRSEGSDGTEGRDEVMQSAHEEEREPPRDDHPSTGIQPSTTKQHQQQGGSTNPSSSWPSVKRSSRVTERHSSVFTGDLDYGRIPKELGKQSSSESGNANTVNSTPIRHMAKTRQPLDGGKSNMGSQVQVEKPPKTSHNRPLDPRRHAKNGMNLHGGRRQPEVTKAEGPGDLTFSPKKQLTPRRQHKTTGQVSRQAPKGQPARRNPATPMTRPMRSEPPKNQPCRPSSSNSNVSKRRAPEPPKSLPIEHAGVGEMLNDDFRGLTHQWNSYFNRLEEYKDGVETELKALRERVATQDEEIEEHRKEMHRQSQAIDQARAERDEWAEEAEEERQIAENESSKVQKLHEKCKEFRTQLNKATEEQQNFYRRNRETILALQKEQETRSAKIQKENDELRAGIKTSVIEASKKAQEQVIKLNEETSTLRVQLDERQKELSSEKDVAEGLRKELGQARLLLSQNVQTLSTQNETILKKLKQCRNDELDVDLCEQTQKLDTVLKSIEDVRVSNRGAITDMVQSMKNDFVKEISGTIREELTSTQPFAMAEKEALTAGIGSIQELCDHIYNQVRENQHSQNLQYMYQESQYHIQMLEERLQEATEQWEQAESWNFEIGQENEEYRAELVAAQEENKELPLNANRIQALCDENGFLTEQIEQQQEQIDANSSLEEQVASLNATISNLRADAEVHQYLEEQVALLEDQIAKKSQVIKESDKLSKKREEVLEDALRRSQGTEQSLQYGQKELQKQLQSTEKDRSRLERDLAIADERIQELTSARFVEETEMQKLRDKMELQNATIEEFTREVQTTQQIQQQLKASLMDWVKDYKEIDHMKKMFKQIDWSHADSPMSAVDLTDDRIRRVVVQSPMSMEGKGVESPPSVEQERETRRQSIPPRSIMRVTRAAAKELEALEDSADPQPMPEKPPVSNHSMYNRPVQGLPNSQSAQELLPVSQKRVRSDSAPDDTGLGNDAEHKSKRARSVGLSGTGSSNGTRPKLSQSMSYTAQDSEDEITEKDMTTRTFGGNLQSSSQSQRGPQPRRNSSLMTYGRKDSTPHTTAYNGSQSSAASSQTLSQGVSQASAATNQTLSQGSLGTQMFGALSRIEMPSQSQGQQRRLPSKHRSSQS
ncbi:hypothetical protein PG991_007014 [Apiospora marii]|uniref:SWI5-dependent HO expression protein 3 n=1 Tax=Apiospora marii TaxID=335849 RepID=A0ABR1RZ16_9PEZI